MAGHGSRFRYNHKSMVDLQNPFPFPASQYEQTHHGIRTCFIDARYCIKYHMHGLYNSLNKPGTLNIEVTRLPNILGG